MFVQVGEGLEEVTFFLLGTLMQPSCLSIDTNYTAPHNACKWMNACVTKRVLVELQAHSSSLSPLWKMSQYMTFITGQKHLANWNFLSGIKNPPCLTSSPYNLCVSLSPLYLFHNIKPFCLYVPIHSLSSVTIYNRWFRSKKGELQSSHMSPCGPTDVQYIQTNL